MLAGGIPVNREKPDAVMGYVEEAVEKDKGVIIVVAPEGTCKKSPK